MVLVLLLIFSLFSSHVWDNLDVGPGVNVSCIQLHVGTVGTITYHTTLPLSQASFGTDVFYSYGYLASLLHCLLLQKYTVQ